MRASARNAAAVVASALRTAFGVAQHRDSRLRRLDGRRLCRSRPASAIFVADSLPGLLSSGEQRAGAGPRRRAFAHADAAAAAARAERSRRARSRLSFDFFPGRPSPALFPLKTWRRLLQANLSHGGNRGLSQYGDPAGLPALRSAIADHLATTRGIATDPGHIIIVNGAQEGISIAARLFLNHGTPSAIEDPCYEGAAFAFEATGSKIASVAVDFEADPGRVAAAADRAPLRHASHQYPTGHTLSLARRHAIVAWARRYGCYILEDDRDGDPHYDGSPLQAIAANASDCTIYLGLSRARSAPDCGSATWSLPEQLAGVVAAAKGLLNNGNSWLEQAALAEMMRAGSYLAHLQRSRARYRDSRDYLMAALRRNFGDVSVTGEAAACSWSGICRPACPTPSSSRTWRGARASASIPSCPVAPMSRALDAHAARTDPRLRGAVAQANRAGDRAALRGPSTMPSTIRAPT